MRILFSLLAVFFLLSSAKAQLIDLTTNYRSNTQFINPAAPNELVMFLPDKNSTLNVSVRQQSLGSEVDQSPIHYSLRYEHYLNSTDSDAKLKWGVLGKSTEVGPITTYRAQGNVAVQFPFDGYGKKTLSVGMNAGWLGNNIDMSAITFASGNTYSAGDLFTQSHFDLSAGVFYRHVNKDRKDICSIRDKHIVNEFYVGLSVPQTLTYPFQMEGLANDVYVDPRRSLSLIGGILFPALVDESFIEVSTWVRNVPNYSYFMPLDPENDLVVSADLNVRYVYYRSTQSFALYGGAGYSTQGMLHLEAGAYLKGGDRGDLGLGTVSTSYSMPLGWESPFLRFWELNFGFAFNQYSD